MPAVVVFRFPVVVSWKFTLNTMLNNNNHKKTHLWCNVPCFVLEGCYFIHTDNWLNVDSDFSHLKWTKTSMVNISFWCQTSLCADLLFSYWEIIHYRRGWPLQQTTMRLNCVLYCVYILRGVLAGIIRLEEDEDGWWNDCISECTAMLAALWGWTDDCVWRWTTWQLGQKRSQHILNARLVAGSRIVHKRRPLHVSRWDVRVDITHFLIRLVLFDGIKRGFHVRMD